jgi:hypothetical protein
MRYAVIFDEAYGIGTSKRDLALKSPETNAEPIP